MSQLVPVANLCNPCSTGTSSGSGTPGPQGPEGDAGAAGADGVDAYTLVASYAPGAQPVMPAEGASVTLTVTQSTAFLVAGEPVYIATWGTMIVTAVPTDLSVTVENPEDTGTGEYAGNAAPGTSLAAGSKIVPSGFQGIQGPAVAGALLAANNLNDVASAGTSRTNLGLGTAAVAATGVGNAQIAPNDAALTDGDAVFATAAGIETQTASDARTSLGLGTMAVQAATAVNIDGGAIDGTTVGAGTPALGAFTSLQADDISITGEALVSGKLFTPASAIQTLAAANQIAADAGKVRVAGSGGAVSLTSTPTIPVPASDGQRLTIIGTDDTNTVTLQNESGFIGTKLKLGAATRVLGDGDVLSLIWDLDMDRWLETGFVNNS